MRSILFLAALAATPAAAQDLQPFEFKGFVAGQDIPAEKLKSCGKGGTVTCYEPMTQISDVYVGYMLETDNYRMSSLFVDASSGNFTPIFEAFRAKYGEPCEVVDTVWMNAAGAEIDNPNFIWCFSTGRLLVARYGAQINKMAILYTDDNQPPPDDPVINF